MKRLKSIAAVAIVAGAVHACGGSGGGGSGASPDPNQDPNANQSTQPTPSADPQADAKAKAPPPPPKSVDELLKIIGASDFKPSKMSEADIAERVNSIDELAKPDFIRVLKLLGVSEESCGTAFSNQVYRGLAETLLKHVYYDNHYNRFDDPQSDRKLVRIESPTYATYSYTSDTDRDDGAHDSLKFHSGMSDEILVQTMEAILMEKAPSSSSSMNCARIYNKTTGKVKGACSGSTTLTTYTEWEETYAPNQYQLYNFQSLGNLRVDTYRYQQTGPTTANFQMSHTGTEESSNYERSGKVTLSDFGSMSGTKCVAE